MNAVWITDYDLTNDVCYKHPGCPECEEPIGLYEDGLYHCFDCGAVVEVTDPQMIKWFNTLSETRVEHEDCRIVIDKDGRHMSGCGGKNCMEIHYRRNPVTLKWQQAYGKCAECGTSFIV